MAFEKILEILSAGAGKAPSFGKTLKFDFGDKKIVIDGTGESNVVSTEDKPADTTISVSVDDLMGIINGSVNPMMAFMSGKIKVQGDMGLAMKLQQLLKSS
ncbi:MAG: SCP2 sterol-binding domain-containing protein [Chitinophagales bacterium]|nr:SCP2 sterol-binding domain-containing protein [Chitinophagales bacterium]MDW8418731.1 SCP2 sterol-binding domain-containing protein [Chitinophagales bacterium]